MKTIQPTIRNIVLLVIGLALGATSSQAHAAAFLNFENTPTGATPVDDAALSTPYNIPEGTVRFYFDNNHNNAYDLGTDSLPHFEKVGGGGSGGFFANWSSSYDNPRTQFASELGTYFLRQPDAIGNVPGPFIAAYNVSSPIRELSGEIWDIDGDSDGNEQWRIDVLNSTGAVLATELSPLGVNQDPTSLDASPWIFQFKNLPDGVANLRLTFTGTKTTGIGLAFNNFSPTVAVPEPTFAALVGGGLLALVRYRRREPRRSGAI